MSQQLPPLFVDLDGTLARVDTLHVTLKAILRKCPWTLPYLVLCWMTGGRAYFKQVAVGYFLLDPAQLPYRPELLEFLHGERARGRKLYLATGADQLIAEAVAKHLPLFDGILASNGVLNNTGLTKLGAIRKLIGQEPFDYAGDSPTDLPLFRAARGSLLVGASANLVDQVRVEARVERVFE